MKTSHLSLRLSSSAAADLTLAEAAVRNLSILVVMMIAAAAAMAFISSSRAADAPATATAATPSPGLSEIDARFPDAPPGQRKEYADSLAARARSIGKLPAGTTVALELPYVANPAQGTRPSSNQRLDLYVPPGAGPFPLIIWIHGGAWKGGTKEVRGADMAARWIPEGFAVASVDYRFVFDAPFPGMFQDCNDAVGFLRAQSAKYRLDPARVGVIGESAGGHLAGVVAMAQGGDGKIYARTGPALKAAVLLCGFYDITWETGPSHLGAPRDDFSLLFPNRVYDPAIARQMSPAFLVHPKAPPVLIIHGEKDTTAPMAQSEIMHAALKKAGTPVTFTRYPEYKHNLWQPDVIAEILAFFKKHL